MPVAVGDAAVDLLTPVRRFERAARTRRRISMLVQGVIITVFMISMMASMVAGVGMAIISAIISGTDEGSSGPKFLLYLCLGYLAFFVVPTLFALPVFLPFALYWRDPRRIVVFRRFNEGRVSGELEFLLTHQLSSCGHIFTLADRGLHVPWFVRIPLPIGQLGFLHFRPRTVSSDRQLRSLARLLRQVHWLNVNWIISWKKIFSIRTSDAYWRACVSEVLSCADLVLVEVSTPRDALRWEIQEAIDQGLAERLVLLARSAHEGQARLWVAQLVEGTGLAAPPPLLTYEHGRPCDPVAWREAVFKRAALPRASPHAPARWLALRVASTVIAASALLAASTFVSSPYLYGGLVARYSPWEWQLNQTFLYAEDALASSAALTRLTAEFPESTTPRLLNYVRTGSEHARNKCLRALSEHGDCRALQPLIELIPKRDPQASEQIAVAVRDVLERCGNRGSILSLVMLLADTRKGIRSPVAEGLGDLLLRLDTPALEDYLRALNSTPGVHFHSELYERLDERLDAMEASAFIAMLRSQSQAARYTAALQLAKARDLRSVPILLEMASVTKPGHTVLSRLYDMARNGGTHSLDVLALAPYVVSRNATAEYAASLAVQHGTVEQLELFLMNEPASWALISELVRRSRSEAKASTVLNMVTMQHAQTMVERQGDAQAQLDGAAILALRGDASGLLRTLELSKVRRDCKFLEFARQCYEHTESVATVLHNLAASLRNTGSFPIVLPKLDETPIDTVIDLTRCVVSSGDKIALRTVVSDYLIHPEADVKGGGWLIAGPGERMAEVLPEWIHRSLIRGALTAPPGRSKDSLEVLAHALVSRHCGDMSWLLGRRSLAERVRTCPSAIRPR